MSGATSWSPLAKEYDPVQCGNIDGTGRDVHDGGIHRALNSKYRPNKGVTGDCNCTLFIGKLNPKTTENTLKKCFTQFGKIIKLRIVRDLVTGYSKRYAFVEFSKIEEADHAHSHSHGITVDGVNILVEREFERIMPGWIPRRFGGGFGGKKESGQLRFGCRLRPFKKPYSHTLHGHPIHMSSRHGDDRSKQHRNRDDAEYYRKEKADSHNGHSRNRGYRR